MRSVDSYGAPYFNHLIPIHYKEGVVPLAVLYYATILSLTRQVNDLVVSLLGRVCSWSSSLHSDRNLALATKILANQENGQAQNYMGFLYEHGKGVKQNDEKAFHYYFLAAHQKIAHAQRKVGMMYLKGKGIFQSNIEGIWHLKQARSGGDTIASFQLGLCFEYGLNDVRKDMKKAAKHYKEAADRGHLEAMHRYGVLCCLGDGCAQNNEEAIKYLQKAHHLGFASSKSYLDEILYYEKRLQIYKRWKGIEQG
jgi:TPR repeat protein